MVPTAVRQGFQQPRPLAARHQGDPDAIDAAAAFGAPNVICFTGFSAKDPANPKSSTSRPRRAPRTASQGFKKIVGYAEQKKVTLCLEMLNSRVDRPPDEGPPRLPGRPHRLLHRHHQAGRLAAAEAAVRHVPRADHGRRRHPPHPPAARTTSATSTPPAIPAAANSTTSRRSTIPPIMRALLEVGYQGYVGQEFIPTRDPLPGTARGV